MLGDPLVRPSLLLAEVEDLPVAGAEVFHGGAQQVDVDRVEHLVLAAVDGAKVDLVGR